MLNISLKKVIVRFTQSLFVFRSFNIAAGNIFAGIHIVNPQKKTKYLKSNVKTASKLLKYAIAINDIYDNKKFAAKSKDIDIYEDYKNRKDFTKQLREELKQEDNKVVNSYLSQINRLETFIHKQKNRYWNFEKVKLARELVNAINTYTMYSITTGYTKTLNDTKNKKNPIEELATVYKWILDANPKNNHDKAVIILWNLSMISQLEDDKIKTELDKKCSLATFTTIHSEGQKEDIEKAKQKYMAIAKHLGYNPIRLHDFVFNKTFKLLKIMVQISSYLPKPIRNIIANRFPFLRERWIIKRKF